MEPWGTQQGRPRAPIEQVVISEEETVADGSLMPWKEPSHSARAAQCQPQECSRVMGQGQQASRCEHRGLGHLQVLTSVLRWPQINMT